MLKKINPTPNKVQATERLEATPAISGNASSIWSNRCMLSTVYCRLFNSRAQTTRQWFVFNCDPISRNKSVYDLKCFLFKNI
jgi:hypothetical protein